jgi:predicted nucleotidyltransferase component of viral defense system
MIDIYLKQLVAEKKQQGTSNAVIANYLKEYIQYLVLSLLYNQNRYKKLVFKGGSCLRICYGLPRLSEDLDFDYDPKQFSSDVLTELGKYLQKEIKNKYFAGVETKIQSQKRLYLKFPFLYSLGLASRSESNKLYVKIEVSDKIEPYSSFEITPISQYGFNFITQHYDLSSLMVGKINALLYRLWFKGKKQEIDIKGRDFYDLFWFMQKKVEPNWAMLKKTTGIKNQKELKTALVQRIKKTVTTQKLNYDLKNFISDQTFVEDFSRNYLNIINKYL